MTTVYTADFDPLEPGIFAECAVLRGCRPAGRLDASDGCRALFRHEEGAAVTGAGMPLEPGDGA